MDLLAGAPDLLIVEGELNTLSLWQVAEAGRLPIDVVSVGSEGNITHPAALRLAARYRHAVIWCDEPRRARQTLAAIPHAHAPSSPNGLDANDLLQRGALAQFLPAAFAALLPLAGTSSGHGAANHDVDPTVDPRPDLGDSATWRRLLALAYRRAPHAPGGLYAALYAARCTGSEVAAGALVATLDTLDLVYPHLPAVEAMLARRTGRWAD